MEDASLEDFLDGSTEGDDGEGPDDGTAVDDGGAATDADADADAGRGSADPDDEQADGPAGADVRGDAVAVDPGEVESAASTYAWSDEAVACEACGKPAERRWRDGDRLVCPDCRDW